MKYSQAHDEKYVNTCTGLPHWNRQWRIPLGMGWGAGLTHCLRAPNLILVPLICLGNKQFDSRIKSEHSQQ